MMAFSRVTHLKHESLLWVEDKSLGGVDAEDSRIKFLHPVHEPASNICSSSKEVHYSYTCIKVLKQLKEVHPKVDSSNSSTPFMNLHQIFCNDSKKHSQATKRSSCTASCLSRHAQQSRYLMHDTSLYIWVGTGAQPKHGSSYHVEDALYHSSRTKQYSKNARDTCKCPFTQALILSNRAPFVQVI